MDPIPEPVLYLQYVYVASVFLFILALRGLGSQKTARMGNLYGLIGMLAAIIGTVLSPYVTGDALWIFFAVAVPPAVIAVAVSFLVKMTAMPQVVGILNAFGGLSACLEVGALYFSHYTVLKDTFDRAGNNLVPVVYQAIFYVLGGVIGIMTFTGSLVACGKLMGTLPSRPLMVPWRFGVNILMLLGILGFGGGTAAQGLNNMPIGIACFVVMLVLAAVWGVMVVLAIGGADMPVAISVLNSGSGWSLVFAGMMVNNTLMTISGAFVGASGIILSHLMCKAMNRSLVKVLMGGFGGQKWSQKLDLSAAADGEGDIRTVECKKVADLLLGSQIVAIVPGYGMAVSRAQFAVREMVDALRSCGVRVVFGIHPVAGRLPGHMNVLLAEANVPYDIVEALDVINPKFPNVDVVLVVGANDIVNPAAKSVPEFPLYGMPVLEVWNAKQTIVMKRSLNFGYAGVDNPLFGYRNNQMLLGDAKSTITEVNNHIRIAAQHLRKRVGGDAGKMGAYNTSSSTEAIDIDDDDEYAADGAGDSYSSDNNHGFGRPRMQGGRQVIRAFPRPFFLVGILNETNRMESRVAMVPGMVEKFRRQLRVDVIVEAGAGEKAGFSDANYESVGATVVSRREVFYASKVILKINHFTIDEIETLNDPNRQILICGFLGANSDNEIVRRTIQVAVARRASLISLDAVPRITVAQKLDVLSTNAMISGTRALVEALYFYGRNIAGQIMATGSYPQAKVLVLGAGVAGLQAVGEAHRMGAEVRGFDIRTECKDQVESLGGKYIGLSFDENTPDSDKLPSSQLFKDKQNALFKKQAQECDIVIATAAVPGKPAPILLKREHVNLMKPGSVIVDVAAPSGGNVEVTRVGEVYIYNNRVTVIGFTDLVSRMAAYASQLFCSNLYGMMEHLGGGANFGLNLDDVIVKEVLITHNGENLFLLRNAAAMDEEDEGDESSSEMSGSYDGSSEISSSGDEGGGDDNMGRDDEQQHPDEMGDGENVAMPEGKNDEMDEMQFSDDEMLLDGDSGGSVADEEGVNLQPEGDELEKKGEGSGGSNSGGDNDSISGSSSKSSVLDDEDLTEVKTAAAVATTAAVVIETDKKDEAKEKEKDDEKGEDDKKSKKGIFATKKKGKEAEEKNDDKQTKNGEDDDGKKASSVGSCGSKFADVMSRQYFNTFSLYDVLILLLVAALTALFSILSPPHLFELVLILLLGCFLGFLLIWNVTSALHTPLMSVTNAISGVVILGGMQGISTVVHEQWVEHPTNEYQVGQAANILNYVAIAVASMNVFGGFAVTQRMLNMFKTSASTNKAEGKKQKKQKSQ